MAECKIPVVIDGYKCVEDMIQDVLNYTYKGKTLKEWANSISEPQTNADRIRTMTDEELADWLTISVIPRVCEIPLKAGNEPMLDKWLDWLKQEVNDDP